MTGLHCTALIIREPCLLAYHCDDLLGGRLITCTKEYERLYQQENKPCQLQAMSCQVGHAQLSTSSSKGQARFCFNGRSASNPLPALGIGCLWRRQELQALGMTLGGGGDPVPKSTLSAYARAP